MTEAQMREMAAQFGYARLGFCSTEPFNEWEARKPRAHKTAQRLCSAPLELAPWAKALCIVVAPYRLYRRGEGAAVSAYYVEYNAVHARGEEFVKALNVRGVQAESLEIPLKPAAIRAGLGAFGKNSIVRIHGMGSCVMLRCIALGEGFECERDYPGGEGYEYADCGKCRRCIDACPSGALSESGMDHTRCLRAHMFQGPPTPEEFLPLMGNRLLGCEECLRACPHNARAYADALEPPDELKRILDIRRAFDTDTRAEYMKEFGALLGWNMAIPNRVLAQAIIVAANLNMRELIPLIEPLMQSKSAAVSEHARWALDRLAEQ